MKNSSISIKIFIKISLEFKRAFLQMRISHAHMELEAKESGMSYALISGIRKIKLAGAEKRAFAKWARAYADAVEPSYNPPFLIKAPRGAPMKNIMKHAIAWP